MNKETYEATKKANKEARQVKTAMNKWARKIRNGGLMPTPMTLKQLTDNNTDGI